MINMESQLVINAAIEGLFADDIVLCTPTRSQVRKLSKN